jgi:hypothetical protein
MRERRSGGTPDRHPDREPETRTFRGHSMGWWVATVAIVGCLVIGMALVIGAVVFSG